MIIAKLKLGPIVENKPVKITVELPASLNRDLVAYADALAHETGQPVANAMRRGDGRVFQV